MNMTLLEFIEAFWSGEIKPWHKELIREIEKTNGTPKSVIQSPWRIRRYWIDRLEEYKKSQGIR